MIHHTMHVAYSEGIYAQLNHDGYLQPRLHIKETKLFKYVLPNNVEVSFSSSKDIAHFRFNLNMIKLPLWTLLRPAPSKANYLLKYMR